MGNTVEATSRRYVSSYDECMDEDVTSITEVSQRVSKFEHAQLNLLVAHLIASGITQNDD